MKIGYERLVLPLCRLILATCTILVIWQAWVSLAKYLAKPQSTAISMEILSDHEIQPVLSICPKLYQYLYRNESKHVLEACGMTPDDYYYGKWASETCPNPKLIREKLTIQLEDMLKEVSVHYTNGSIKSLSFDDIKKRNFIFDWEYGQCYLLEMVQPHITKYIEVFFIQEAGIVIHSLGLLTETHERITLQSRRTVYHNIELEVVHALDYLGQECYMHNQGNYDFCILTEIDKYLLSKVECTTPFGFDMDNICKNETLGAQAFSIADQFYDSNYEDLNCKHPCSILTAKSLKPEYDEFSNSNEGVAYFYFPKRVRILRSQYSFSGFSFVAEVGGYVGLFLGANFLQFSDLLRLLVRRYL